MNSKQQLRELVRHIIKETLEELMSQPTQMSSLQQQQQPQQGMINDPTQHPVDAMTPIEKMKFDHEQEKMRRDALKAAEQELKTAKKEKEFQQQKVDQSKRFKIPTLTKQIQQLKGSSRTM